jgi:hypothetical protein
MQGLSQLSFSRSFLRHRDVCQLRTDIGSHGADVREGNRSIFVDIDCAARVDRLAHRAANGRDIRKSDGVYSL